jgi:hypothetical protein
MAAKLDRLVSAAPQASTVLAAPSTSTVLAALSLLRAKTELGLWSPVRRRLLMTLRLAHRAPFPDR